MSELVKALQKRLTQHNVRVLTLDIETQAALAYTWGIHNVNIGINQIVEAPKVMCLAYKWLDEKKAYFLRADDPEFAFKIRELLCEADYVVHFNGTSFDIPHLQREILLAGLTPPSPFKQIDLLRVVRKQFKFISNKLDHVVQQLGIGAKVQHAGFDLWKRCAAGDAAAWKLMEKYNLGDIKVTEALYIRLIPWIAMSAHLGQYIGQERCCSNCGSTDLTERGVTYANVTSYKLFECAECGRWLRGTAKLLGTPKTRQAH